MKSSFNLQESPLRLAIFKRESWELQIHVTTLLILLLGFAVQLEASLASSCALILAWICAYICAESFFLYNTIRNKGDILGKKVTGKNILDSGNNSSGNNSSGNAGSSDLGNSGTVNNNDNIDDNIDDDNTSNSPRKNVTCIMPFGLYHASRKNNSYYNLKKFYFYLILALLLLGNIAPHYFASEQQLSQTPLSFIEAFIFAIFTLSFVNLIPLHGIPGQNWTEITKVINKRNELPAYMFYLSVASLGILAYISGSLFFAIIASTLIATSVKESFYGKTWKHAGQYRIKDLYTPMESLRALPYHMSVKKAAGIMLRYPHTIFPIFQGETFVGFVHKEQLLRSIGNAGDEPVSALCDKNFVHVNEEDNLADVMTHFTDDNIPVLAVYRDETILGFLFLETTTEYLLLTDMLDKIEEHNKLTDDDFF